jgi:hypothetical protein
LKSCSPGGATEGRGSPWWVAGMAAASGAPAGPARAGKSHTNS